MRRTRSQSDSNDKLTFSTMMPKLGLFCAVSLGLIASGLTARAAGTVSVYLSSPFAQTAAAAGYTGTTNATFDTSTNISETTNYVSPIGTFAPATGGNFNLLANNQFGGGGQGGYLAVTAGGGTVTLTLANAVGFLSLEWCAIDAGNQLTFLDAVGNTIGSFNAGTINGYLDGHPTVSLANGTNYTNAQYKAQPNADGTTKSTTNDTGEYFGYVSFIATGAAIKSVVISETGATFESDNWSTLTTAPTPAGASVLIATVPEPSAWALAGLTGALAVVTLVRRRAS